MEALQIKIAVDIAKKLYKNLLETRKKSHFVFGYLRVTKKGCSQVEQPRNQDMIFPR